MYIYIHTYILHIIAGSQQIRSTCTRTSMRAAPLDCGVDADDDGALIIIRYDYYAHVLALNYYVYVHRHTRRIMKGFP